MISEYDGLVKVILRWSALGRTIQFDHLVKSSHFTGGKRNSK